MDGRTRRELDRQASGPRSGDRGDGETARAATRSLLIAPTARSANGNRSDSRERLASCDRIGLRIDRAAESPRASFQADAVTSMRLPEYQY